MKIIGTKVHQWRPEWDQVDWDPDQKRAEPQRWFYVFSISARALRAWSGVNARQLSGRRRGAHDLGIQRRHESARSEEIRRYVSYGYPLSTVSERKREMEEFSDLRKPGWLPTAIVVNVLRENDRRHGRCVAKEDLIEVKDRPDGMAELVPPRSINSSKWDSVRLPPIEVIDGQHRLWAFDSTSDANYEFPVVLFHGLDLSWQAYLFYTINIKPKKINPSLAFDLYPLLRTQDWLLKFEGHIIYRETRAQELVDLLWSHEKSPWFKRINMLGEPGQRGRMVTQAAWVRALLATFVKSSEGPGVKLGGLFGSAVGSGEDVLPWSRIEQAAFLIFLSRVMREAVQAEGAQWAKQLRSAQQKELFQEDGDPAFYGEYSLLSQDQGIRAFLHVANDLFFMQADELDLENVFEASGREAEDEEQQVTNALNVLSKNKRVRAFAELMCSILVDYDWRAFSAPGISEAERIRKAAFRGSGGYKELRTQLLKHAANYEGEVGVSAEAAIERLGY